MNRLIVCAIGMAISLPLAGQAHAADDRFEVWLSPTITKALDDDTAVEFETAQRFRDADKGPDTYYARLWLHQDLSDAISLSGGIEGRVNDGDTEETRLIQQAAFKSGMVRARVRLEQRFVDDARFGMRVRARGGIKTQLSADRKWQGYADLEGFFTLRSTSLGGQDGLTGVRSQIGVTRDLSDNLTVGLTYLRQQDVRRNAQDRVAHVPLIGIDFSF